MSVKPTAPGNWVYSLHDYNFGYGTFADGVVRHDDFGITVMNAALDNANAWRVPLYIGEFTNFSLGVDARQLTDATMVETGKFLSWAKRAPRELDVLGLCQRVHADDRHRPDNQSGHPGGEARTGRRPRRTDFERASRRIVHKCLHRALLQVRRHFVDRCGRLHHRIRVDLRRRGDEHRVRADAHLCDGGDVFGHADGHRQPRCDGRQDVCRDRYASLALRVGHVLPRRGERLGVANQGGSWTPVGTGARFAVNGAAGAITMPTPGSGPSIFLNAVSSVNTDVQVTATTDRAPTGGGVYAGGCRSSRLGAGDYRAKIRLRSTGQVGISLSRASATGAETAVTNEATVAGLTYAAADVVADPCAGRGHQSNGPAGEGLGRVRGGAVGLGNDRVRLDCRAAGARRCRRDELLVRQRHQRTRRRPLR